MKAQMRFQKAICLTALIMSALFVFYACAYLTGSMANLSSELNSTSNGYVPYIDGADLYLLIQDFNDQLLWFGIVLVVLAVCLYITGTNKRRKYYITNYIATGVFSLIGVVLSVVAMVQNFIWENRFLTEVDFTTWASDAKYGSVTYSDSTVMFDLGTVFFILFIIVSLLLVFNLIWKISNEKQEKKLLEGAQLNNVEIEKTEEEVAA